MQYCKFFPCIVSQVPQGKHIKLKFSKFSIHTPEENTLACPTDYLELNYRSDKSINTVEILYTLYIFINNLNK